MATKQGTNAAAADGELDPKIEWMENPTNYVLRLNLSGFKKEDFRVQVDGAGRLTVRGQRPAGADGKLVRFHKVFQLPSTANLDEISGRFHANVLTLTVPKRPAMDQEVKKPKEEEQEDTKPPKEDDEAKKTTDTKPPKEEDEAKKTTDTKPPKEDEPKKQDDVKKPRDEPKEEIPKKALDEASKVQQKEEEEAKRRKQEQEQKPSLAVRKEEVMKPKAEAAAAPTEKQAKPEAAGERAKSFDSESLGERMRRRAEEDRAKAAAAAEEAEREKKTAVYGGWKERVVGELEELADMKWADRLVEAARENKEVIAAAVAAFSLGFFVSQKLFSRK